MRDRQLCKTSISSERTLQTVTPVLSTIMTNVGYRLRFELTDSAKLLHFIILGGGGPQTPRAPPLNDATDRFGQDLSYK